jgi:hypothetical protein
VASGMNAAAIGNGVVAVVTATLAPATTSSLDSLIVSNVCGALPNGTDANLIGIGGTISVLPKVSALQCSPTTLAAGASSACTVNLSLAAPSGGTLVNLSENSTSLTVPTSVTVSAGAISATFQATAGTISSSQSATITALYSGTSATASVSLTPVLVSSVGCSPISLGPNSSSSCTVTLTQPAPSGGASLALSNSNSALTIPTSVSVAAASTFATFSATTAAISSNVSAILTASYNSPIHFEADRTGGFRVALGSTIHLPIWRSRKSARGECRDGSRSE